MICGKVPESKCPLQHHSHEGQATSPLRLFAYQDYGKQHQLNDSHRVWNTVDAQYWFLVLPAINRLVSSMSYLPLVLLNTSRQILFGQRGLQYPLFLPP